MTNETFTCGRRLESGMADDNSPFVMSGSNKDTYRTDGTCSYCGSVSQSAFLDFVKAGGEVGPTDKNYKVYLRSHGDAKAPGLKFYFQHLDKGGKEEFIQLHNDKKMRLGLPGHFYVRPYFTELVPK